ncbi:DUF7344 domain-containing protein [Halopiger goleimassiliensis]|uniref:DUF7344 domain-containing protein n=1 Tax=Halopiger goleimassiliensis TaxID=1293048 RepID=UPI000677FB04|nr:hypothetical protein [Halopiger goleimassiliensis]
MGGTNVQPSGGNETSVVNADGESDGTTRNALSEDELFTVLSNRRRRYVLQELIREGDRIDIGTLSQQIAAYEDGLELHEVSSSDRKRVYTALHQSHLPKLDETGLVEFDRDRGTVEPTATLEDVEIYMDLVHGRGIPWSDYYLGVTALIALSFVLAVTGPGPFAALSLEAWGVFAIVTFGTFALVHRYYARRNRLGIEDDSPAVELEYDGLGGDR